MVGVEQTIERLAVPAQSEVGSGSQRGGDAIELAQGNGVAAANLDPGNRLPTHARGGSQIQLAPAATVTERSCAATEPDDVHPRIVRARAYLALTRRVGNGLSIRACSRCSGRNGRKRGFELQLGLRVRCGMDRTNYGVRRACRGTYNPRRR